MDHTVLSFVAPLLDATQAQVAEQLLAPIGADPDRNAGLPLGQVPMLHFASFTIFAPNHGPEAVLNQPYYLAFEANFDGALDDFLDALVRVGGAGLSAIYQCCEGFAETLPESDRLKTYLRQHVVRPPAWHIGNPGLTAEEVKRDATLRAGLEQELDALRASPEWPLSETAIARKLHAYLEGFPWTFTPYERRTLWETVGPYLRLGASLLLLVILALLLLPLVLVGVYVLRQHERADDELAKKNGPVQVDVQKLAAVEAREDASGVQNHLSNLIPISAGGFRLWLLRLVLWGVNLVARVSTHGKLGGIPSIHFAHWSIIDGGRQLLFYSNFDNSFGSYLDDFTDKASVGLTAIWSNTVRFPHTEFLICKGASDGGRFKVWARIWQSPTLVHYRAYPNLSVGNIDTNFQLRDGARRLASMSEADVRAWLKLL